MGLTNRRATLLRRAAGELGKTVVLVLHDINFASCYSDRIVAMREMILADTEPELAAQMLAGDEAVAELVGNEVAARAGLDVGDIRVRLLAGFAVTAGREVLSRWASSGHASTNAELGDLLESAFSIINPDGLTAYPPH